MWKPFSELKDIPAPPLLDDILPSQIFTDDLDSFSASQALSTSPGKGHGILKSRSTGPQPRPRVRFVPPIQRNPSNQPNQTQSQVSLASSQEDLFSENFNDLHTLKGPLEKGHDFDDQPYQSQPIKEAHEQIQVPPQPRHSQDDDFPPSIHIPALQTPGGTKRGAKCLRSIEEIPDQYRSIFSFSYFNFVQSQVLDDILYTDKPLVVSAPTGSGKTVLFELAILRLLISQGGYNNRTKVVYMAPIKVLCSQRCDEWKEKFEPLGLKCQELTGDTDIEDFYQLQAVNIIFTTPEKWDSMTRKWRDNHSLVQLVKLFLIDEVHSLNEETRGATVEAVISRMKTVQAALPDHQTNSASGKEDQSSSPGLRFLAVSATIPNIKDIADWLGFGNETAVYHKFDESHRPVKLRKVVLGYPCSQNFSEFKFDLSLNYKLSGVIQTYSENKPSLVFCATRKAVEQAASILVKEARFILNAQCRQRLQMYINRIRDSKLRERRKYAYSSSEITSSYAKHMAYQVQVGDTAACTAQQQRQTLQNPSLRERTKRDLDTLAEDLEKFKLSNIPKECNNVIRPPLFRIPLNQICPPGLHLSLGIFLKHFNALEHQCHALDLEAASILARGDDRNGDDAFNRFVTKKRLTKKISELEEEHKDLIDQHLYMSLLYPDSQPVALLEETAREKRTEIKKLEAKVSKLPEMTEGQGPIVKALDGVLQTIHVKRQAYHGRSFVGNHVHKCLKEENVDKITDAIINKTNEVCPVLCEKAQTTAKKFNTLFKLYGSCHTIFNSAKVLTMEEISKLDLVMNGVGYHHAGLDLQDRKAIEDMFLQGDLPVLMATSTLAMGVNLPAHLVVVKSTQHYACGMYTEYSETQILQMIGRAGRPQFDTTATAVIMTKHKTKIKYDNLLNGTEEIESSLHNHLIEHLNAEIVLHTINNMDIALEWLKSTFLYIRIQKNPTHYGLPKGLTQIELEKKLKEMCTKDLASLASINLIQMDQGSKVLKPLETGRLMARYCVAFETMKQFTKLNGNETVADLMVLLSRCKEFSDVQLRVNERKVLNKMNKDKNHVTIRYPMNGKIKTNDMKVNCLIQATLGSIPIQEFALNQDCYKIFRAGQRLTRCLTEYLMTRTEFKALLNAVVTSKCIQAKLWENSKYVARQLEKIGPTMSNALVHAGLDSFQKLENKNPRELELIVNRHPPFGNQIVEAVSHLPKYDVSIEQISKYSPVKAELNITVYLQNHEKVAGKQTTKPNHNVILLIGDANNKVVYKQRIADTQLLLSGIWMRKIEVKRAMKGEDLSINLISQDFVGLDVQSVYSPFYSGPKHLRAAAVSDTPPPQLTQKKPPLKRLVPGHPIMNRNQPLGIPDMLDSHKRFTTADSSSPSDDIQDFEAYGSRKPCSHRCLDKDTCAHDCCKFGIPIRPRPRPRAPSTKRLQTPDQGLPTPSVNTSSNSYDQKSIVTTPSRPRGPHGIDGVLNLMRQRARDITVTPNIKRLKFSDPTTTPLPKLDQFTYTPKRNLLPAMNRVADTLISKTPSTTATPKPKDPQRALGWEHLDFYRHQRQMELSDLQSEESHGVEEDVYGVDDNDELPEVSLGFDKGTDDLPCFDIGGNDIYDVDDMDDIICMDDLEVDFHPDLCDDMKENSCPPTKSSVCPTQPPKQEQGYLWSDIPPSQPCSIQEQSVPNVEVPPGWKLCRGKPGKSIAASSATLSMPVMEYCHTSNAVDQYVPLVRRGHPSHQPMRPAYSNTLRQSYGPLGGCGVQSLPRPQLSTTWTKPLPTTVPSGKPGTRQPERLPLNHLYGKAVRNLGFNPVTPTTKPPIACPASNTSPDELSLVSCLDAVEQDYLQQRQGTFSKYSQRPGSFFVNTSPKADDDIPEFDSIFKDLF